jgi:hypothetical protein
MIAENKTNGDAMTVKGAIKTETIGAATTVEITNPENLGFNTTPSTTILTIGSITATTPSFSFQSLRKKLHLSNSRFTCLLKLIIESQLRKK